MKKDRIYMDYNIYTKLANEEIFIPNRYYEYAKVYISVAHVEEFYNAKENDKKGDNKAQLDEIRLLFTKKLNNSGILNPQIKGRIINKKELFDECLERVSMFDTRKNIEDSAVILHKMNKDKFAELRKKDINAMNNSNCSIQEIWDRNEVVEGLSGFSERIKLNNNYSFDILKEIYGDSSAAYLSKFKIRDFTLERGLFRGERPDFKELELTIEFLQELLNACGYYSDKNQRTTKSGIYDTEHAIYATYCTYFVTDDKNLRNRLDAIYFYLGISTKCISYNEWCENLKRLIKEKV